jgi:PhnB protein
MPKTKSSVKAKKKFAASKKVSKKTLTRKTRVTRPQKKKVQAIPKGYHAITPYLIVDNAVKAIEFYKKAFGAKLGLKMDRPDGKIVHAELKIGDSKIMLADACPELGARSPKEGSGAAVSLHFYVKNVDKIVERAIAGGAKLLRPLENAFYGDRCALLQDQYGHQWHVATHIEDVSTRELKKRAAQAFK